MSQRNEADAPRGAGDAFDGNTNAAARGKSVVPGVLDVSEMLDVQLRFGVDEEQVRRDHAISHALAALSRVDDAQLVFFGGTALSRTLLPDLRLSEDIDLVALAPRREVARAVQQELEEALGSTLGVPTFTPTIESARHPLPSVMEVGDARVQIQLLDGDGYPAWSTAIVDLEQRYADAPPARMRSLTPAAFVASKLTAWADRVRPETSTTSGRWPSVDMSTRKRPPSTPASASSPACPRSHSPTCLRTSSGATH